MFVNVDMYLATGSSLMHDAVTHWFYLFQEADRMLGKKKEYWQYGSNGKLKRPIYAEMNRKPCTQI